MCPVKGRNGEHSPHQQLSRMGDHFRWRKGGGGSFLVEIWGLAGEKQCKSVVVDCAFTGIISQ